MGVGRSLIIINDYFLKNRLDPLDSIIALKKLLNIKRKNMIKDFCKNIYTFEIIKYQKTNNHFKDFFMEY